MFWRCTPADLSALLKALHERETALQYAANMRAGLIASVIANVHRGKNKPAFKPADFIAQPAQEVSAEDAVRMFTNWATDHNATQK